MGVWSIGKIRGRFQPEDFTETQDMKVKDLVCFGSVTRLMFAGWSPREVSISFVVDSVQKGAGEQDADSFMKTTTFMNMNGEMGEVETVGDCPVYDPERVWAYIQALQRPKAMRALMEPIVVMIPGWGDRGDDVKYAYITHAQVKRTHISSKGAEDYSSEPGAIRAVRATFTLTLKEAAIFSSEKEAEKAGQSVVK